MSIVVRKPGFRIARSYEVCFSSKGDRLACIGVHVDLWDVPARTRIARAHPFKHPSHIDFSPDGSKLAVKSTGGDVAVLDGLTLEPLALHDGRPWGEGAHARFSPCGEYLVDGSWAGVLLVREALSGDVVYREEAHDTMVSHLACTVDRQRWIDSQWRRGKGQAVIRVRSWPFSEEQTEIRGGDSDAVAMDPSGTRVAVLDRSLQLWDVEGQPTRLGETTELPISGTGWGLAWSPSGETIALAGAGKAHLLTSDFRELWQTDLEYACAAAFAPAGHLLALGAWSKGFVIATPV
jgi:WD40 repeat protein